MGFFPDLIVEIVVIMVVLSVRLDGVFKKLAIHWTGDLFFFDELTEFLFAI